MVRTPATQALESTPIYQIQYLQDVDWDLQPVVRRLVETQIPRRGSTSYEVAHPVGFHDEETSFIYGQQQLSIDNWPNFMYFLSPPKEWLAFKADVRNKPKPKKDNSNQLMTERWPREGQNPRPLKHFPGLPDQISSNETWWWIELTRRLHPFITLQDITMRMHPITLPRTLHSDNRLRNCLNMQSTRGMYGAYSMVSWYGRGLDNPARPTKVRSAVLRSLSQQQLNDNSTRGSTPGFVNPALGIAGGWIDHPEQQSVRTGVEKPLPTKRKTSKTATKPSTAQQTKRNIRQVEEAEQTHAVRATKYARLESRQVAKPANDTADLVEDIEDYVEAGHDIDESGTNFIEYQPRQTRQRRRRPHPPIFAHPRPQLENAITTYDTHRHQTTLDVFDHSIDTSESYWPSCFKAQRININRGSDYETLCEWSNAPVSVANAIQAASYSRQQAASNPPPPTMPPTIPSTGNGDLSLLDPALFDQYTWY